MCEGLEGRTLLAVTLSGVPGWVEQGPGPITGGQVEGLHFQGNPVAGAVEAIAPDPTNPNRLFVGTVNGGVWGTLTATASSPAWFPLTDQFGSLSIASLAMSPLNPAVLWAGTGRISNGGRDGGPQMGILLTVDGGVNWSVVGGATFNGSDVRAIMPTTAITATGQVVLAGAHNNGAAGRPRGLFRSTDGGLTFTQISGTGGLPNGPVSDLAADPTNASRFFASVPGSGVFVTTDVGVTWAAANTGLTGAATATQIEISVGGTGAVFAAVIPAGGQLSGVFRSADSGATWTAMDTPSTTDGGVAVGIHPRGKPGGQGNINISLLADRTDGNVVFIGGDRQPNPFPNSVGAINFTGRLFRGDASLATGTQWASVTNFGADPDTVVGPVFPFGTGPHADSREMVFDAAGNILEGDDGGVYRLVRPNDNGGLFDPRRWVSANGNLRPTEFYSIAYDNLNDQILGGTQDVGSAHQNGPGSITWSQTNQGDGGVAGAQTAAVGVSLFGLPLFTFPVSVQYTSAQFLGSFSRRVTAAGIPFPFSFGVGLGIIGGGGVRLNQTNAAGAFTFDGLRFTQPYVLNEVALNRMLIGTSFLYESTDAGDNLTALGGLTNLNANGIDEDGDGTADDGDEFAPAGAVGLVTAMEYGGMSGGVANPDATWVGAGGSVLFRTTPGNTFTTLAAYPGAGVQDIATDQDDFTRAYVLDNNGRVFRTTDSGATWTNITGDLPSFATDLRTIEVMPGGTGAGDEIVVVGGQLGVYRNLAPAGGGAARWTELGSNLPNALVTDLRYDLTDDVLVAGTFGRGAWTIPGAFAASNTPAQLVVQGDDTPGFDDDVRIMRNAANPTLLDVILNGIISLRTPFSTIGNIAVSTFNGNDTLTLDFTNGNVIPGAGVGYNGGFELSGSTTDTLNIIGNGTTAAVYTPSATTPGSGTVTIAGRTVTFSNLTPVDMSNMDTVTLVTPSASDAITIDSPAAGTNRVSGTSGGVAMESLSFSNVRNVVLDAETNDGAGAADTVTLSSSGLVATGLSNFTVRTGGGGDTFTVLTPALPTPAPGRQFRWDAGAGPDRIVVSADGSFFLSNNLLADGAGGNMVLTGLSGEDASLTGGPSANTLALTSWSGTATLDGAGGGDTYDISSEILTGAAIADSGAAGTDVAEIRATNGPDAVTLTPTRVRRGSQDIDFTAALEELELNTLGGDDTVSAVASPDTAFKLDGGSHFSGDTLNFDAENLEITISATAISPVGRRPFSFEDVENVNVSNVGAINFAGDGADNILTVNATGTDSASMRMDAGPLVTVSGLDDFEFAGAGGADTLTINNPPGSLFAPPGGIRYDGGGQAGDALQLFGGGSAEFVEVYSVGPGSGDGTIEFFGPVNLRLTFTGLAPITDTVTVSLLTVNATADANVLRLDDGGVAGDGRGRVSVDAFEPMEFERKAALVLNGGGLADSVTIDYAEAPTGLLALTVNGGAGGDTVAVLRSPAGVATRLNGDGGDDAISMTPTLALPVVAAGGDGNDVISTAAGNDHLIGGAGNDALDGGAGDDALLGDLGTVVTSVLDGSTATTLESDAGHLVRAVNAAGTVRHEVALVDAHLGGDDVLVGGAGNDALHGGAGADRIEGDGPGVAVGGRDNLFGDAGNDLLTGGGGDDNLFGGAGDDNLIGASGNDIAYGGDGQDRLEADALGDRLIDVFGNYNLFVVNWKGFGGDTIVRSLSPEVRQFVLQLASAAGAVDAAGETAIVEPASPTNSGG